MATISPSTAAGLARERTALAWNRSGLAIAICTAGLLRHVWPVRGTAQALILGGVAGAGLIWVLALFAYSVVPRGPDNGALMRTRAFSLTTAATLALAVAALGLVFFGAS